MINLEKILAKKLNTNIVINNNESTLLKESICLYDIWSMGCGDSELFEKLSEPYFKEAKQIQNDYNKDYGDYEDYEDDISDESYSKAGFYDLNCFKIINITKNNEFYNIEVYFLLPQGEKFIVDKFVLKEEKDYENFIEWFEYFFKEW